VSNQPPPPPPPVVPVPDVDTAHASLETVTDTLDRTISRAAAYSTDELNRRVDDEWSTIESLQHIIFVVDLWLSKAINGEQDPFHPIGLPPSFVPRKFPGSSIDPDAKPTLDEAVETLRGRLQTLSDYVAVLTQDELDRAIEAHAKTVGGGLSIIFDELEAHDYFINRDLDKIDAAR
jgi:hypothetical protein